MPKSKLELIATDQENVIKLVQDGAREFYNFNDQQRQECNGVFISIKLWDDRVITATPRNLSGIKLDGIKNTILMDRDSADFAIGGNLPCLLSEVNGKEWLVTETVAADPNNSLVWQITKSST